ncbi:hypothetical protein MJL48_30315, partial [Salmonella enterica subsp. enterica serovar Kentucky]|nr:hypothetical protein [Salmonella enterica subsp. enterica serovar Kentucky]
SRDYRTFNDHVWANNKDSYDRDENDVYDIADYYQNDFGRKNRLLNALLNTASGATWVSLHHGGGVGMGFSQHAGMVIVCDGTDE